MATMLTAHHCRRSIDIAGTGTGYPKGLPASGGGVGASSASAPSPKGFSDDCAAAIAPKGPATASDAGPNGLPADSSPPNGAGDISTLAL